uniref:Uncharacterized protein n=1 Tax=blood disease bacterium R229 TaxID=741978 RepID=G2ZMH4_9RALS|nr:conserved hypothetical protein [blood disease bacterium R229]
MAVSGDGGCVPCGGSACRAGRIAREGSTTSFCQGGTLLIIVRLLPPIGACNRRCPVYGVGAMGRPAAWSGSS